MKEIVIATKNPDKKRELANLLKGIGIKVISLDKYPGSPAAREGNISFRENAIRKAMAVSKFTQKAAISDDSGLETEALGEGRAFAHRVLPAPELPMRRITASSLRCSKAKK